MTREEKNKIIDDLVQKLKEYKVVYVTDNSELNVEMDNALRRLMHKNDIQMKVVKNTLVTKAVEKASLEWGELIDTLKGTTALLFSTSPKNPAKAIKKFRTNSEKPILKGAFIDSSIFLGDESLTELSKLKSKEDLIGEIIGLLQSPASNVISALQSGGGKLAGILKTLSEKE